MKTHQSNPYQTANGRQCGELWEVDMLKLGVATGVWLSSEGRLLLQEGARLCSQLRY